MQLTEEQYRNIKSKQTILNYIADAHQGILDKSCFLYGMIILSGAMLAILTTTDSLQLRLCYLFAAIALIFLLSFLKTRNLRKLEKCIRENAYSIWTLPVISKVVCKGNYLLYCDINGTIHRISTTSQIYFGTDLNDDLVLIKYWTDHQETHYQIVCPENLLYHRI